MPTHAETTLQSLLIDYATPVEDDGFSDGIMSALPPETVTLPDAHDIMPWRNWLVALSLGGAFGLAAIKIAPMLGPIGQAVLGDMASRDTLNAPDWSALTDPSGLALYLAAATCAGLSLLLIESGHVS